MEKLLLTPAEVSEAIGIGRTIVYELLAKGELVSVKIGARRYVPSDKLIEYVNRLVDEQHEESVA